MPAHENPRAATLDDLIRRGKGNQARAEIRRWIEAGVRRPAAAEVARLAMRLSQPDWGIRVLNPIVRAERRLPMQPSDEEKAEYAACLAKSGAAEEALSLLSSLDTARLPQVLLYRSFALVSRWDYAATIPLLNQYSRLRSVGWYQQIVGKVNLVSALIFERRHRQADLLLRELLYQTSLRGLDLLLGNVLKLSAQNFVLQGKWEKAESFLAKAREKLSASSGIDEFFIRKWESILELRRSEGSASSLAALQGVREEAVARAHWETTRDCDLYLAICTRKKKRLLEVYFGTPYPSYRKRLLLDYGEPVELPSSFVWKMPGGEEASLLLDLTTPDLRATRGELEGGSVLYRLFSIFATDFYRSFRLPSLHALLYPGENFMPSSSPNRLHQQLKRLKDWLSEGRIPITITERSGWYRLQALGACSIRVPLARQTAKPADPSLELLREKYGSRLFSLKEASAILQSPDRTVSRLLLDAMQAGKLRRIGRGRTTRYALAERTP